MLQLTGKMPVGPTAKMAVLLLELTFECCICDIQMLPSRRDNPRWPARGPSAFAPARTAQNKIVSRDFTCSSNVPPRWNGGISNGFRCCWRDCFSLINIFPRRNSSIRRQAERVTSPCPLARKRYLDFKVISKSWHSRRASIPDPSST